MMNPWPFPKMRPAGSEWNWMVTQARILGWIAISRGSSQPRIQPRSPALQADSLPAEPQGKSKNTGSRGVAPSLMLFSSPSPGAVC